MASRTTTDHDEIRRRAEQREGRPAAVEGTGSGDDPGSARTGFPGRPLNEDESLEEISWDEWFHAFDANGPALVYDPEDESRFDELVSRSSVEA